MKTEQITVLDLGNTCVRCLSAGEDGQGGLQVLAQTAVDCRGLKRGVVADLEETSRAVDAACRGLEQKTGTQTGPLVVAVGGQHVEGQNAQGFVPIYPRSRLVTREDVLQVVNHSRQLMIPPDREQIQALPREFRIDGQRGIQRPIGMNGSKLEVITYIVTGQSTHIQNLERALSMVGRKVDQMVLKPLAAGIGALTTEQMELGAAVVDIGGGATDVGVFVGGSIAYSGSVPIGGELVTSDLSKLLKTTPEEAERLKVYHASAVGSSVGDKETVDVMQLGQTHARPMQRRVLCEIVESRMRELAGMVRRHIEKSGYFGVLPAGVILTGGGSLLPGADKLFEDVLQHLRVAVVAPQMKGLQGSTRERQGMAVSLGLARFAFECAENELAPASGITSWKDRVRTFWSLVGGRA
jgi:cell division protein FtsA